MKDFVLETEIWLPQPREIVFEFFKDAANLERITPPFLNFQIVTPLPIEMHEGRLIEYKISLYNIPMRWKTQITQWNPPFSFQDSQLKGPYTKWVHTHTFEERDGGTWMHDKVEYRVPGGFLSVIPHKLFVRKQVETIFEYRKVVIQKIFAENKEILAGSV